MKLMMKTWRGTDVEVSLQQALTPTPYLGDRGAVEDAQAQAEEALEVIGRMLAALVERGVLPLEDALKIAGTYYEVKVL